MPALIVAVLMAALQARAVAPSQPAGAVRVATQPAASRPAYSSSTVRLARSADGLAFRDTGEIFMADASSPALVRLPNGDLLAMCGGSAGSTGAKPVMVVSRSADDGRHWTPAQPIRVAELDAGAIRARHGAFAWMPDGSLRLYFVAGVPVQSRRGAAASQPFEGLLILSAVTRDGLQYKLDRKMGLILDAEVDVCITTTTSHDGRVHLFLDAARGISAMKADEPRTVGHLASRDGRKFGEAEPVSVRGVRFVGSVVSLGSSRQRRADRPPSTALAGAPEGEASRVSADRRCRAYVSGDNGARSLVADDGVRWKAEDGVRLADAWDPAVVQLKDGTFLMLYCTGAAEGAPGLAPLTSGPAVSRGLAQANAQTGAQGKAPPVDTVVWEPFAPESAESAQSGASKASGAGAAADSGEGGLLADQPGKSPVQDSSSQQQASADQVGRQPVAQVNAPTADAAVSEPVAPVSADAAPAGGAGNAAGGRGPGSLGASGGAGAGPGKPVAAVVVGGSGAAGPVGRAGGAGGAPGQAPLPERSGSSGSKQPGGGEQGTDETTGEGQDDSLPPKPDFASPVNYVEWLKQRYPGTVENNAYDAYDAFMPGQHNPSEGNKPGWPSEIKDMFNSDYNGPIGPWDPAQHPDWEATHQSIQGLLDQFRQATRYERYACPLLEPSAEARPDGELMVFDLLLPSLVAHRAMTKATMADAWRTENGQVQPERMLDAMETSLRNANHMEQGYTLIHHLVGFAEQALVQTNARKALQHNVFTSPEQLETALDTLRQYDHYDATAATWLPTEHAAAMDAVQQIFTPASPDGQPQLNRERARRLIAASMNGGRDPLDDAQTAALNEKLDKLAAMSPEEVRQSMEIVDSHFRQLREKWQIGYPQVRDKGFADLEATHGNSNTLTEMVIPGLFPAYRQTIRNEASRRATQLSYEVHLFKARNGRWPSSLNELPQEAGDGSRVDPFTGSDFGYQMTETGPKIYTSGEDGQDNGGVHSEKWDDGKDYVGGVHSEKWDDGKDYVFWPPQE